MNIVIFAAGEGKRMKSSFPKPLHSIGGVPILKRILDAAKTLNPQHWVVVGGFAFEKMQDFLKGEVPLVFQKEQKGTADALLTALPLIDKTLPTLALVGDAPLISPQTLRNLKEAAGNTRLALLTAILPNPTGYGRITRDAKGEVVRITEEKDASPAEKKIKEVNMGMMVIPPILLKNLGEIGTQNAQQEKYLTDMVAIAREKKVKVVAVQLDDPMEGEGINDKIALSKMERYFQQKEAQRLMAEGLTLLDPQRFDLRGNLTFGRDVVIDVGVILEGKIVLNEGAKIGAYCVLKNVEIGKNAQIEAFCHIENAKIGDFATVGPYARLRPGSVLEAKAHVGNFVEIKNSRLGENTKAGHLSYLGDSDIAENVNIGAGTITCNFDGVKKHKTTIQKGAFIGSGTELVAPVEVGENALIGAGSTLTQNAPSDSLTLSRAEQKSFPKKNKK